MRHRSDEREYNNRSNRGNRSAGEQAARRWTDRDEDRYLGSQNQRSSRSQQYNDNRPFASEDFQEEGDRYERDDYGQFGSYDMQSRTPEAYHSQRDSSDYSSGEFGQMGGRERYNDFEQPRSSRGGQQQSSRARGNFNPDRSDSRGGSPEWGPYRQQSQGQDYGSSLERPFYGQQTFSQGPYGMEPGNFGSPQQSSRGRALRSQHTGKGPKGYSRSDDRIKEDVCEALSQHGDIDASEIEVDVSEGEVVLKGTVEEKRIKRLAEECVENLSGVKEVTNQLRVGKRPEGQSSQTQSHGQTEHGKQSRIDSTKGKAA